MCLYRDKRINHHALLDKQRQPAQKIKISNKLDNIPQNNVCVFKGPSH